MSVNEDRLQRRTVLKSAAWSVPVVAASVATPLAAASGGPPPVDTQCMSEASTSVTFSTEPVSGYLRRTPVEGQEPGYYTYDFKIGQSHQITTTATITYSGSLPVRAFSLQFRIWHAGRIDWTLAGAPRVSSSRQDIVLGSYTNALPLERPPRRSASFNITLRPTGADGHIWPGDILTLTWDSVLNRPSGTDWTVPTDEAFPMLTGSCDANRAFTPSPDLGRGATDYNRYRLVPA